MAIDETIINTLDDTIAKQAETSVKRITDAVGNTFEKSSLKEQIEARQILNNIAVKKARTSMFDKFTFAKKWEK